MSTTVDIVIPWVDGSDEAWLSEKKKYNPNIGEDANINRYRDWGLLRYWFRGVENCAPWVNKIHFITWGHLPSWLNTENEKLHVVKHSDYIPKDYLPVFSSHPIELNMNRIEGLSEHFIYSNDDFYFLDAVEPTDFFVNGKPIDCVEEAPLCFFQGGIDHNVAVINKHFNKREVTRDNKAQWFSLSTPKAALKNLYMQPIKAFSSFANPHVMQPFLKSTLNDVWANEAQLLETVSSHRFRSNEDVSQWLFRYWQFAKGNFVQRKIDGKFFSIGKDDTAIKDAVLGRKYKTVCLSDDDIEIDFDSEQRFLVELFSAIFPDKCSFEK